MLGKLKRIAGAAVPKVVHAAKAVGKSVVKTTNSIFHRKKLEVKKLNRTAVAAVPNKVECSSKIIPQTKSGIPKSVRPLKVKKTAEKESTLATMWKNTKAATSFIVNETKTETGDLLNLYNAGKHTQSGSKPVLSERNQKLLENIKKDNAYACTIYEQYQKEKQKAHMDFERGKTLTGAIRYINASYHMEMKGLDYLLQFRKTFMDEYPMLNWKANYYNICKEGLRQRINEAQIGNKVYDANIPSTTGAFARGFIIDGAGKTLDGMISMKLDPYETLEGIVDIAKVPEKSLPAIYKGVTGYVNDKVIHGTPEERAEFGGNVCFQITSIIAMSGLAKAAELPAAAEEITNLGKTVATEGGVMIEGAAEGAAVTGELAEGEITLDELAIQIREGLNSGIGPGEGFVDDAVQAAAKKTGVSISKTEVMAEDVGGASRNVTTEGAGNLKPQGLLDELANSGVKYNPDDVVAVTKTVDGKLVWLENGNPNAGLDHIMNHADNFAAQGISKNEISNYVMDALENGKIVGYQGRGTGRPIYEFTYKGEVRKVAVTTGSNGFVVGANPVSTK